MEDKVNELLAAILEVQREMYIETQTIEQYLVRSNICTVDDFQKMREVVQRISPKVCEITNKLDNLYKIIDEHNKFDELFMKQLRGQELTEEENDFILSKLDLKSEGK